MYVWQLAHAMDSFGKLWRSRLNSYVLFSGGEGAPGHPPLKESSLSSVQTRTTPHSARAERLNLSGTCLLLENCYEVGWEVFGATYGFVHDLSYGLHDDVHDDGVDLWLFEDFALRFARGFAIGFLVGFPTSLLVLPAVRRLASKLTSE